MELPCACNDSGRRIIHTIVGYANHDQAPLDEILHLHQSIQLLTSAVLDCLFCSTNDDVVLKLLDALACLGTLYKAAQNLYCRRQATGNPTSNPQHHTPLDHFGSETRVTADWTVADEVDSTPGSIRSSMPLVVLGRIELTESEADLVGATLIRQGLSQTGSHLRDLQHHLTKCMVAKQISSANHETYKRRIASILNGIYSSLACL